MNPTDRRVDWQWIDTISFVNEEQTEITAHRHVIPAEWYFEHHFECYPVLPGVFLVEMMARAAGLLQILRVWQATHEWAHYLLAGTDATRFYHRVGPDSRVELSAAIRQGDDDQVLIGARASVDGQRVARTDIMLQRVRADWLTEVQDDVVANTLRRVLTDDLKRRYGV
jgi:3-hydroxyacyl-[acyl-carrier-protein] dehydratase